MATLRAAARILTLALRPLPRSPEHALPAEYLVAADSNGPEAAEAAAAVQAAEEAEAAAEEELVAVERGDGGLGGEAMLIDGDGELPPTAVWCRLRQLLRCAEPYCHPSNTGPWSSLIGFFLQALAQFLSWRALHERTGLAAAAAAQSLSQADVAVLMRLLSPMVARALYSKASQLVLMSQMAARYLAELAPDIVLLPLQIRLCDGLQAVTATHQTPMALQTLALLTPMLTDLSTAPRHSIGGLVGGTIQPTVAARRALSSGPRLLHESLQLALPGLLPRIGPSPRGPTRPHAAHSPWRCPSLAMRPEAPRRVSRGWQASTPTTSTRPRRPCASSSSSCSLCPSPAPGGRPRSSRRLPRRRRRGQASTSCARSGCSHARRRSPSSRATASTKPSRRSRSRSKRPSRCARGFPSLAASCSRA